MFKKVLLVDGFDIVNISVGQALSELSILEINEAKYCDDAFIKIRKGLQENEPYDLLISDLSFKKDCRNAKFNCGEELITAVKKIQPNIKTIVFSEEDKSFKIKSLFKEVNINAFVHKGRDGISELKKAVQFVFCEDSKISTSGMCHALEDRSLVEIEEYDISILKLLSFGFLLKDISSDFKKCGVIPNSSSSIEKRINKLKIYFRARNNTHLIAMTKDMGIV
jgi:two-component system, NarL family, captular synthesis response regulator RcsB